LGRREAASRVLRRTPREDNEHEAASRVREDDEHEAASRVREDDEHEAASRVREDDEHVEEVRRRWPRSRRRAAEVASHREALLDGLTCSQLKAVLRLKGLPVGGQKADLVARVPGALDGCLVGERASEALLLGAARQGSAPPARVLLDEDAAFVWAESARD